MSILKEISKFSWGPTWKPHFRKWPLSLVAPLNWNGCMMRKNSEYDQRDLYTFWWKPLLQKWPLSLQNSAASWLIAAFCLFFLLLLFFSPVGGLNVALARRLAATESEVPCGHGGRFDKEERNRLLPSFCGKMDICWPVTVAFLSWHAHSYTPWVMDWLTN